MTSARSAGPARQSKSRLRIQTAKEGRHAVSKPPPSALEARFITTWSRFHLWVYRRTGGRVLSHMRGRPTLLLTTTGRRTGAPRAVPLPYLADGDTMVVVGSNSGAQRHPDWVRNVMADPRVTVQLRAQSGPARADILEGAERTAMWERIRAEAPWYAGYQERTSRRIPLVRLTRAPSAGSPGQGG